jgi:4'-phosphopantetheinyl transferase
MALQTVTNLPWPPPLDPDDVDLWTFELDATAARPGEFEQAQAALPPSERSRCAQILRRDHRRRVTLARAAVRIVLARYLAADPAQLVFETNIAGKPSLPGAGGPLQFNLSHAGDLALVAITARASVGVDVERADRAASATLRRRALADDELRGIEALDGAARDEAFMRHWTAKEAFLKATGEGLSGRMSSVVIADAAGEARLVGPRTDGYTLCRLDPQPGYVGAVVAAGAAFRLRHAAQGFT